MLQSAKKVVQHILKKKKAHTDERTKTNKKLALQSNQNVTTATSSVKQESRLVMDR